MSEPRSLPPPRRATARARKQTGSSACPTGPPYDGLTPASARKDSGVKQLWAPWRLEYIKSADEQPGCLFCDAAAGDDEERLIVRRGTNALALLNKFPYASGHFMPVLADVKVLPEHLEATRRRLTGAWPT